MDIGGFMENKCCNVQAYVIFCPTSNGKDLMGMGY